MPRLKSDKLKEKARLVLAHKASPTARKEVKSNGVAVGSYIRYLSLGTERHGVVRKIHRLGVDVELVAGKLLPGGENIVVREETVAFADVKEVLGQRRLAERPPGNPVVWPLPPPRPEGYTFCDIGNCEGRPVHAFAMQKYDEEVGELGPMRILAVCKAHNERYKEGSKNESGHIPLHWKLGVVFNEWRIPPPDPNAERESENEEAAPTTPAAGPYTGKRGRHPNGCECGKHKN